MIRISPFFLRQRSYHFRRNWSYISFPVPFKSSYVFPRPFKTPKFWQIPFLFLGTHTRFVTTNMSYRNRICNLLSSCLAGKDLPPWKRWFIRISMKAQLHCIARIHVVYLKEVDLLPSLMVQSSSRWAPFLLGPQRQNVGLGLAPTVNHGRKDLLSRDH